MTVPSEQSSIQYDADGVSVSFPVPFRFIQDQHLRVTLLHAGVETVLVLGADYSVSGANDPAGGSITTTTAYPPSDELTIERIVPITQETHYQRNDPFPERAHEQALDKLTMICQQIANWFGWGSAALSRVLMLGRFDVSGSGSYRANNNRISNLGDPQASRDAVHRQWVDARISEAAIDGAGEFVVERLADTDDPDNGGAMIAIPTPAGGTTLNELAGRRKSLKDFGAIMDGVTDDSAAIDAAAASGRAIYYDEGVARNVTGAEPAVRYGPGFIRRPDGITLPAQPFEHAPDVRRILSGMEVDRLSDTQLRIYTGCCTDSTGRLLMRLTANLTVNISTVGLNGLDTGTPEVNAGYQIYMVMNTDTGQVGAVVSKAITYGGVTMPAGFSRARKLPWAFVLRGGVVPAFLISGWPKAVTNYTSFATVTDWAVAENITSLSFTVVDFSAWMPDAARIALLQCVVTHDGVGAAGSAFMRVSGSQGVTGEEIAAVSGAGDRVVTQVESRVTSARTLTFRVTGGAVLSIYMQGYVNVEPS